MDTRVAKGIIALAALLLGSLAAGTIHATQIAGLSALQQFALGLAFSTPAAMVVFAFISTRFDEVGYWRARGLSGTVVDLVFIVIAASLTALLGVELSISLLGGAEWVVAGMAYVGAFAAFLSRCRPYWSAVREESGEDEGEGESGGFEFGPELEEK